MKQQAERGVLWRLADAIGGQTISFVAFLILARLLRPDDSGVLTLAAAIVATRSPGLSKAAEKTPAKVFGVGICSVMLK
jgi:hypothetical protein